MNSDISTGLYVEDHPGPGVPRVFLNGIGMTTSHWKPFREHLKPGRDVLHDFRDQLRSEKADAPYDMLRHAHELASLLDRLEIESAALIGTSYGAEVAMLFALQYPERCRSLVLIDGVSEMDEVLSAAVESWKVAALANPRVFYRCLIPWNYSAEYIAHNRQLLAEREEAVAGLPREYFEGFARLCDAFLQLHITDELKQIRCPTHILVGELDILKTHRYSELMRKHIPGSNLSRIPGAGHAVVIEKPQACASLTQTFLDSLPG